MPDLSDLLDLAAEDGPAAITLRRFLADGEAPTRTERRALRDAALRDALAVLAPAASWRACVALAQAVQRFEARVWPRLRDGAPVGDLGPLDAVLLRARLAAPLPATARQLWNLLNAGP